MEALYSASMKKSGLDLLKNLMILSGGAITSSVITNDLNCLPDGDLLVCQQDATVMLGLDK